MVLHLQLAYHIMAIYLAQLAKMLYQDTGPWKGIESNVYGAGTCLLYTSDAADERSSVDLGGRRIIKKKNTYNTRSLRI